MKKYLGYTIFFLFLFILNMNYCHAETYKGKIHGDGVYLRSGPGVNYATLKTLSVDNEYMLVSNTIYKSEKECSNGWYKIYYEGSSTGYVCSDYVEIITLVYNDTPTNECEQSLADLGFPSSYWPSICSMKESHPNWQFKPIFTGLEWSEAVENESSCGTSYIASSVPTNIDNTCTNKYTKTWYPASSSAVAYYMDPRNFLTEQYIFQFEYLKYDEELNSLYAEAITNIVGNAEFYKYHFDLGNNLSDIINDIGKENNISPIFVSSRILQEMGSGTSLFNLYSGIYEGFIGYYNFYNFGVTDSCATSKGTTLCGLEYAEKNNWYGLYAALQGGASQIANGYIAKGQYNTYLQKFNVTPINASSVYTHQYMTNIQAPSSEAKTTYNTYKKLGLLDNLFVFYIPVFNNMDNANYSESNGAVDLPEENTPTIMDISTIVTSSGYNYRTDYISGISEGINVGEVKNAIESISGTNTVTIKNSNDQVVDDGIIGTGFKVIINNSVVEEVLNVIIKGDTSGDGVINALDLLQVQKSILGTYTLSGVYALAGDTSGDGVINALDLLQVQKHILDTYQIEN